MWATTVACVEKWKGFKSEYRNSKQMQMTEIRNIDDMIEAPRSKLRGMFCLTAVLRIDRKEVHHFLIRSLLRFKTQNPRICRKGYEPVAHQLIDFLNIKYFELKFRISDLCGGIAIQRDTRQNI